VSKAKAILGSTPFFLAAPVVVAGVIPWWITRWSARVSNFKAQPKFSASHATLDRDRACSAAQDGTLSLSKAAIRLTQMMKAGHTLSLRPLRQVQFKCARHHRHQTV
jgi:hypothetical protein